MHKTLYLIRHGTIKSNLQEVYAGRSEERLTEAGVSDTHVLGKELQTSGISLIYTSPLARTRQTAEILNRYMDARLVLEPNLVEMDLGPWTGLSKHEVARKYPFQYQNWLEKPADFRQDGIERLQSIQARTLESLQKFVETETETIGAVVTHAVIVKCAVLHYKKLPLNAYHRVAAPNLCVYRLSYNGEDAAVTRVR